jgi:predicted nucleotidyltransferase
MERNDVVKTLTENRWLLKPFSVKSLSVFGSTVRGEATDSSDVDILVEFEDDARIGLFRFIELKQFLEGILHCPVDLGTPDTLRPPIREQALREAIRVA